MVVISNGSDCCSSSSFVRGSELILERAIAHMAITAKTVCELIYPAVR